MEPTPAHSNPARRRALRSASALCALLVSATCLCVSATGASGATEHPSTSMDDRGAPPRPSGAGDVDGDGFTSVEDMAPLFGRWLTDDLRSDLTLDGVVSGPDLSRLLSVLRAPRLSDAPPKRLEIGMNLAPIEYFQTQWAFVDVAKSASHWFTQPVEQAFPFDTGDAELLDLDEHGYVRSLPIVNEEGAALAAATLMCRIEGGAYPAGRYVCLYEGDGEIRFGFDAREVERTPGRIVLDVTPSNAGILMRVLRSNPENHIRNVRVYMPGFEWVGERARLAGRTAFHPLFLERLAPFGTLRFMDWQRTNGSTIRDPDDLPSLEDRRWSTASGAPLDVLTDLCNALRVDAWICVPHAATDETMRHMAERIKARLDEGLRVYVEYSNEVWNTRFEQYHWVSEATQEPLIFPAKYAIHCRRVFETFEEVFADRPDALVRVVAGQHYNPWVLRKAMEALEGDFDAASTAAYFGLPVGADDALSEATTEEDLIPLVREATRFGIAKLLENKQHADEWEARFIAYEAGQHLSPPRPGTEPAWGQELRALQRREIMEEAYQATLRHFASIGGDLFMAYNFCQNWDDRFGYWGALQRQDEDPEQAVKYRVLRRAAEIGLPIEAADPPEGVLEGEID